MSAYAQQMIGWLQALSMFLALCVALLAALTCRLVRDNQDLRAGREPAPPRFLLRWLP